MRMMIVAVVLGVVVLWSSPAPAQPTPSDELTALREQVRAAETPTFWETLLPALLPIIPALLFALQRKDPVAWFFVLALGLAFLVFWGGPRLLDEVQGPLGSWWGPPLGALILTVVAGGLFVLHLVRPAWFAVTEIAFGVVGVGYTLAAMAKDRSEWAGIAVALYGIVEGFTRLRDATAPKPSAA